MVLPLCGQECVPCMVSLLERLLMRSRYVATVNLEDFFFFFKVYKLYIIIIVYKLGDPAFEILRTLIDYHSLNYFKICGHIISLSSLFNCTITSPTGIVFISMAIPFSIFPIIIKLQNHGNVFFLCSQLHKYLVFHEEVLLL